MGAECAACCAPNPCVALRRWGMRATGVDMSLATLEAAEQNLRALGVPVRAQWGPSCPVHGPHNPRSLTAATPQSPLPAATQDAARPPPPPGPQAQGAAPLPTALPVGPLPTMGLRTNDARVWRPRSRHTRPPPPGAVGSGSAQAGVLGGALQGVKGVRRVGGLWSCCGGIPRRPPLGAPTARPAVCASNLPFGRFLRHQDGEVTGILRNLAGQARMDLYVFISGECLRPVLLTLSYQVLWGGAAQEALAHSL